MSVALCLYEYQPIKIDNCKRIKLVNGHLSFNMDFIMNGTINLPRSTITAKAPGRGSIKGSFASPHFPRMFAEGLQLYNDPGLICKVSGRRC
jgi:hypothetical protein